MRALAVLLLVCTLATPALALNYPVSGRFGESGETKPGPIDCAGKRVIRFEAMQRFDSGGGVPAYRLRNLVSQGDTAFRVTEEFHTGQVRARIAYTLRLKDQDGIELVMSPGGTLKLRRCA